MNLRIHPKGMIPTELVEFMEKHLRFALGRFSAEIRSVVVRLTGSELVHGGMGTECRISIRLSGSPMVIVVHVDEDIRSAVARATGRAERAVARRLGQNQGFVEVQHPMDSSSGGS